MTAANDPSHEDHRRIDRVLHALAKAEPADAMQARLVAALHTADTASQARHVGKRLHRMPPLAPGGAAITWLAVAACLLATAGVYVYRVTPRSSPAATARIASANASREIVRAHEGTLDAATLPQTAVQPQKQITPSGRAALEGVKTSVPSSRHAATAADNSRTRSNLDAESFPPPPLPLTEQEHLLLRVGRQEPAKQLALLAQPAQDAAFEREKAAVAEFFLPAPPLRSQQEPLSADQPTGQP